MQVVRNEFVVALEWLVGDVEVDGALFFDGALAYEGEGLLVALQERRYL